VDKRFAAEVTAPILNKLGALLGNPAIRGIVTKHRPKLDAREAMDRGRIVLGSLAKGQVGEDAALLLGGLLIGAFQNASMSRADVPLSERRPFSIVVDEISSFVTGPFLELLAEARKYGVSVTMATQSLAAMDEKVRRAMLTNIRTLVAFRAGADDIELLLKEFAGRFRPDILMSLDVGECIIKSGGEPARIVRVRRQEATGACGRSSVGRSDLQGPRLLRRRSSAAAKWVQYNKWCFKDLTKPSSPGNTVAAVMFISSSSRAISLRTRWGNTMQQTPCAVSAA
jgi:hypothetical protein